MKPLLDRMEKTRMGTDEMVQSENVPLIAQLDKIKEATDIAIRFLMPEEYEKIVDYVKKGVSAVLQEQLEMVSGNDSFAGVAKRAEVIQTFSDSKERIAMHSAIKQNSERRKEQLVGITAYVYSEIGRAARERSAGMAEATP